MNNKNKPEKLFCPVCGTELDYFSSAWSIQNLLLADSIHCPNKCAFRMQLVLPD